MSSQHQAKFFWGAGAQSVHIAGNFNNWSATATPLQKLPDGTFAAEVPLPWGEKQAFKYVVDGEWKVREDEAKEWDAAGNMNNVYTAPPASAAPEQSSTPPSTSQPSAVPPASEPDTTAPAPATNKTEPEALIAASAPGAASAPASTQPKKGEYVLGGIVLGGPVSSSSSKPAAVSTTTTTTTAAQAVPVVAEDTTVAPDPAAQQVEARPLAEEPTPVQIEEVAKNANIGEATTADQQPGLLARAAELSGAAVAAATAAAASAAAVVERATGVDLTHGSPLTVEEAKAQGIDVNSLKPVDASNDTPAPVGTTPDPSAVAALEEKVQELKVGSSQHKEQVDVPLPNGEGPKTSVAPGAVDVIQPKQEEKPEHDLPAQHETVDNHTVVPAPVIVAVSDRDPAKDRTLNSTNVDDTIGTKPISSAPGESAKVAKEQVDANPAGTSGPASNPAPASAPATTASAAPAAPATPAKTNGVGPIAVSSPAPVGSGTPAPVSATSTPASTPAKSTHTKDGTEKRRSGFLNKLKSAVSRKDKEKK